MNHEQLRKLASNVGKSMRDADLFDQAITPSRIIALLDEIEALKAHAEAYPFRGEIEALRKDAERYRWLRGSSNNGFFCEANIDRAMEGK